MSDDLERNNKNVALMPNNEEEEEEDDDSSVCMLMDVVSERISMASNKDKNGDNDLEKKKQAATKDASLEKEEGKQTEQPPPQQIREAEIDVKKAARAGCSSDVATAASQQLQEQEEQQRPGAYRGLPGVPLERNTTVNYDHVGSSRELQQEHRASLKSTEFDLKSTEFLRRSVTDNLRASSRAGGAAGALGRTPEHRSVDNSGLVEANPVSEAFRASNLQAAAPFDSLEDLEEQHHRANKRKKQGSDGVNNNSNNQQQSFQLWIIVVLLLAIIIVVPVTITRQNNKLLDELSAITASSVGTPAGTDTAEQQTPTIAPSVSKRDYVLNQLPPTTVGKILKDYNSTAASATTTSPQTKAFDWILEDDDLLEFSKQRVIQRFVLAALYFATQGENWLQNDDWLSHSSHECDWFSKDGSKLYWPPNDTPNFPCAHGVYNQLWLYANNLRGELPMEELALLTSLTSVSLNANPGLSQSSPSSARSILSSPLWGKLTNLEQFDVGKVLVVDDDSGTGDGDGTTRTIPSQLGLLTALTSLNLLNNYLTGTIPTELFSLPKLQHCFLDNNYLTGTIPTQIGAGMLALHNPYFHSNLLSGTIPSQVGLIQGMNHFSFDQNLFTGTLPTQLGQMSTVEHLVVMKNLFTGRLPSQLGLLSRPKDETKGWGHGAGPFFYFNAGYNQFTGQIPSQFGTMSYMRHMWLNDNNLSGSIPSELEVLGTTTGTNNANESSSLLSLNLLSNPLLMGTMPGRLCWIGPASNVSCPIGGKTYQECGLSFDCIPTNNSISTGGGLCGCDCDCAVG